MPKPPIKSGGLTKAGRYGRFEENRPQAGRFDEGYGRFEENRPQAGRFDKGRPYGRFEENRPQAGRFESS